MKKDKKGKTFISRHTPLQEIVEKYPEAVELLAEKYHLFCVACLGAAFETLEQGARAHGMEEEEIDKMVEELNRRLDKANTRQKKVGEEGDQRP